MDIFRIKGGKRLSGEVAVSGAKNVALKAMVAACLTYDEVKIENIPLISDLYVMSEIIKKLGGKVKIVDHDAYIKVEQFKEHSISLDDSAHIRTSLMFLAPLLTRVGKAMIPNPGGCRLGARPIDRTVEGLKKMGAEISYDSADGYFHASVKHFRGTIFHFDKNTHTGTETLIIAAALAHGKTVLENAACEPEVDELILLLNKMGAKIRRTKSRVIEIEGVRQLHGTEFRILPDRNEIVTFATAAIITEGDILIKDVNAEYIKDFVEKLREIGGGFEEEKNGLRFFYKSQLKSTNITTKPYPGFMTDWQAPWAVLMTKAKGTSVIHETVFENRFGYVKELKKMGAKITLFNPHVENPESFYNFNHKDDTQGLFHAAKITGPTKLHDAIVRISDLRAGATLVIAALSARGETLLHGAEIVKRGYEDFDKRLCLLGADIKKIRDEE